MKTLSDKFVQAMHRLFDTPEAAAQRELGAWNAKPTRQSVRRANHKADKRVTSIIKQHQRQYPQA